MRITNRFRLLVLCLIAASAPACSPLSARSIAAAARKVVVQEEFHGYGLTLKDAEAHALERACKWLADQANLNQPPTADFLREKDMVRFVGEPNEREFDVAKDFAKDGMMKVVTLHLEITDQQARDLQKQSQQQRMKERQKQSLLGLIGAMGLLGVVVGYLHLEEATKGYYTRLLRIAAICWFVALVLGLCMAG